MKKIDAHLHLVRDLASYKGLGRSNSLGNGEVVWDNGFKTRLFPENWGEDNFTIDSALKIMKEYDVEKAVLLQGSLYGFQNYYSWQAAKKYPQKFIAAFSLDPFADEAMKILKRHVQDLGFRIMKLEISQNGGLMGYHHTFKLDESPMLNIFEVLKNYPGFTIAIDYGDIKQKSHQPDSIVHLAKKYPQLDFVVCHMSFPNADKIEILKEELLKFSKYSNIYCDIAAIQDIEDETSFPYPRCQKDISLAKNILGPKKLIWGSDGPWSATFNNYDELFNWLKVSGLFSEEELEDILYNNAERIYFKPQNITAMKDSKDPLSEEM